jgi:RNA polymerase sigma-70 factor (ECF subfamily)
MPGTVAGQAALDGAALEACRRGDREAQRALFESFKDSVYSLAFHILGDAASAGDVTQQVFLKLFARIGQYRGEGSFSAWLYRLVVNECLDERRSRRRFVPLEEGAPPGGEWPVESSQERGLIREQLAAAVRAALAELKPEFRAPVALRYLEGLSYEEISSVLGCSSGTVASRLNRAHKILAKKLAPLRGMLA